MLADLVRDLASEDAEDRLYAVIELGDMEDPKALEALATPLADPDDEVRFTAAEGVADSLLLDGASENLIRALIHLVERTDRKTCPAAGRALRNIGKRVLPFLFDAMEQTDAPGKSRLFAVVAEIEKKQGKWKGPTRLAKGNLTEAKRTKTASERDAVEDAVRALGETKWNLRVQAAKALGGKTLRNDARALEGLEKALGDGNAYVRRAAAESLGRIGKAKAITPLIESLDDNKPMVRMEAARALGRIGSRRATEPLMRALGDGDAGVRYFAADALRKLADERALAVLTDHLGDDHYHAAVAAKEAILRIGRQSLPRAIEILRDPAADWLAKRHALEIAESLGDSSVLPEVKSLLEAGDSDLREQAVRVWSRMQGDAGAAETIARLLDEASPVRRRAAQSLGELKHAPAVPALIEALGDEASDVRDAAARALGDIGDPRALDPLVGALRGDDDDWVRQRAAESLGKLGDPRAVSPLTDALGEPSGGLTLAAARALGSLRDRRALETARALAASPDALKRVAALELLLSLDDRESWELVAGGLSDGHAAVRRAAAAAANAFRDDRTLDALFASLDRTRPEIVYEAYPWLISLGQAGTEPLLIQALLGGELRELAIALARCGNADLEKAAREWFRIYGSSPTSRLSGPRWGESWSQIVRAAFERAKAQISSPSEPDCQA